MFCPNCGTFAEDGSSFCPECGQKLTPVVPAASVAGGTTPPEENDYIPGRTPVDYPNQVPATEAPAQSPMYEEAPMQNPTQSSMCEEAPAQAPVYGQAPVYNQAPVYGQTPSQPADGQYNNGFNPQGNAQQYNPQFNQGVNQYNQPAPAKKSKKGCLIAAIIAGVLFIIVAVCLVIGAIKIAKNYVDDPSFTEPVVSDFTIPDENETDADDEEEDYLAQYLSGDYSDLSKEEIEKAVIDAYTDIMLDGYALDEITVTADTIRHGADGEGEYIGYLLEVTIDCEENEEYYANSSREYLVVGIRASTNTIDTAVFDIADYDSAEDALQAAEDDYFYWID